MLTDYVSNYFQNRIKREMRKSSMRFFKKCFVFVFQSPVEGIEIKIKMLK